MTPEERLLKEIFAEVRNMKPIVMNSDSVLAIIQGRKTQTRRLIPEKIVDEYYDYDEYVNAVATGVPHIRDYEDAFFKNKARYRPGDILWVREAWCPCATINGWLDDVSLYGYKADYDRVVPWKWKPSIHMPREAARLFLRVTGVRVERVNEISNTDCIREGINNECCRVCVHTGGSGCYHCNALWTQFRKLWDSLNAKRGFGWDATPWVWVYSFERVDKPAGWPGGEGEG